MQETRPANVSSGTPVRHPSDCREIAWNPKLLDRLREALRSRHYSRGTEQTYCHWVQTVHLFPQRAPSGGDGGEEMSFFRRKGAGLSTAPVKIPGPYPQRLPLHYGRQNPIQLSKSNHHGKMEAFDRTKSPD